MRPLPLSERWKSTGQAETVFLFGRQSPLKMIYPVKKASKKKSKPSAFKKIVTPAKEALTVELKLEEPKARYLKLEPFYREYRTDLLSCKTTKVPKLRLCGNWLEKAGFNYGEYVSVTVMKGLLVIRPSGVREGNQENSI